MAACTVAYILSPVQLIPTIIPVIGQLDDALALYICTRVIRRVTPESVIAECQSQIEEQDVALAFESFVAPGIYTVYPTGEALL